MKLRKSAAVALALLLTVAAVGCGSTKSSNDVQAADAGKSEKPSDDNATTTSTTRDDSSTGSSGSSSDTSVDYSNLGAAGDCLQVSLAYAALILRPMGFMGGASQEDIDKFEADTEDLKAKMPPELSDDFDTIAAAYSEYGQILKDVNFSDLFNEDTQQKLEDASAKLDSDAVKTAQDHVDAYFKQKCGDN